MKRAYLRIINKPTKDTTILCLLLLTLLSLSLSACSKSDNEASTAPAQDAALATTTPAASNPTSSSMPGAGTTPDPHANLPGTTANNLPKSGKVIKAMHAGGYTYMQVEDNGKQFWIAATMLNVKRNDRVSWADAAVMKDFKSSSLRRTFDEILFVSAAEIQK